MVGGVSEWNGGTVAVVNGDPLSVILIRNKFKMKYVPKKKRMQTLSIRFQSSQLIMIYFCILSLVKVISSSKTKPMMIAPAIPQTSCSPFLHIIAK